MKIQMLYRKYLGELTLRDAESGEYVRVADNLFIRAEEINVRSLDGGLKHIKERDGEHFINCVPA